MKQVAILALLLQTTAVQCPPPTQPPATTPAPAPVTTQPAAPAPVVADTPVAPPVNTAPPPVQQPTGPSPTAGWVLASSVKAIPTTDFNVSLGKSKAGIPGPAASPDNVGAFRFICGMGQILPDDPIVYPGQPGKSHLHQFYGNTGGNAYSTYASLRTSGQSNCSGPINALNRSLYWLPAMFYGPTQVLRPNYATIYYKRFPGGSAFCSPPYADGCVEIPTALKMIAGKDMTALATPAVGINWSCVKGSSGQTIRDPVTGKNSWDNMDDALANCPNDGYWDLNAGINFYECWDGVNIDSPNHRMHVAYQRSGGYCPKFAQTGKLGKHMPTLRVFSSWHILKGMDKSKLYLSSDMARLAGQKRGSTLHGDYIEAWDPPTKTEWTDGCINKFVPVPAGYVYRAGANPGFPAGMQPASCTGGNLGDGFALTGAAQPPYGWGPNPNEVVDIADLKTTPIQ